MKKEYRVSQKLVLEYFAISSTCDHFRGRVVVKYFNISWVHAPLPTLLFVKNGDSLCRISVQYWSFRGMLDRSIIHILA